MEIAHKPSRVFELLGISQEQYRSITDDLSKRYSQFVRKKSSGGHRILYNPSKVLKKIQKRVLRYLTNVISIPSSAHGGVKGKSNITNVNQHKGNKFFFSTDISNFYPSISYKRVYNALVTEGFSADTARIITKLTTYRGSLPQGSPTSAFLSIVTTKKLQMALLEICVDNGLSFTMYIDDLMFSSKQSISQHAIQQVVASLIKSGFKPNRRKTRYRTNSSEITGVLLTQQGKFPQRKHINKLQLMTDPQSRKGLQNYIDRIRRSR